MNPEVRIVFADDHPVFRRGLRMVIETDPALKVVAEAGDGAQALARVRELNPDVILLDVSLPDQTGFDVARELVRLGLEAKVVLLTMHKDEGMFNTALDLGVKGYLLKESAVEEIVAGVKAVARGENFISPQLSTFLFNRGRRAAGFAAQTPAVKDLTAAERQILKLIAENKPSREIAATLFISPRTVDRHRENICAKLGLRGSNALLKFALAHKEEIARG